MWTKVLERNRKRFETKVFAVADDLRRLRYQGKSRFHSKVCQSKGPYAFVLLVHARREGGERQGFEAEAYFETSGMRPWNRATVYSTVGGYICTTDTNSEPFLTTGRYSPSIFSRTSMLGVFQT